MKKGVKIFLIIWLTLAILFVVAVVVWFGFLQKMRDQSFAYPGEKITIDRNYADQFEKQLIDKAEQVDCYSVGVDLTCFKFDNIQAIMDEAKQINAKEEASGGHYVRALHYKVDVYQKSSWPQEPALGFDGDSAWSFGVYYFDMNGRLADSAYCMSQNMSEDYWVVKQSLSTFAGTPNALASSGDDNYRYILFNQQSNPVCQAVFYSLGWIS